MAADRVMTGFKVVRRAMAGLLILLSLSAQAGKNDWYECRSPSGAVSQSIEPCAKGETQVRRVSDEAPVTADLSSGRMASSQVVAAGAHFRGLGAINGVAMPMLVDTGATVVSLGVAAAQRAGLDLRRATAGRSRTANGEIPIALLMADSVSFAGHTVRNVPVAVRLGQQDAEVLLGMSFLRHFDVSINGGVLTLTRK